jgi:hypothetical protein
MPPPPKKVVVYESECEFLVYPPVVVLDGGAGEQVEIVNYSEEDAVWFVGPGLLDSGNTVVKDVPKKGGKSGPKKAKSQGKGNTKASAYTVLMVPSGKKAKGNSDPMIIVEN